MTPVEMPADESESLSAWWQRQKKGESRHVRANSKRMVSLSSELEALSAELTPHKDHVTLRKEFLRRLEHHLAGHIGSVQVSPFGSAVNGFWTPHSDVDVCVRVPGATTRNAQINILRKISSALKQISTHHIEPRFGAQVPIVHWAPQHPGMVACDISVNNVLAVVNSRLIGDYVKIDERLRTLGMCIKVWAQARGINDRSQGTMSSFALVMMLVHFLQRRNPPILPSLQDISFSRSQPPDYIAGVDCRWCSDEKEIASELDYLRGGGAPNDENVGLLMLEFFRHFGYEYRSGILRIRDTRSFLPPGNESNCYLIVDNPFEVGKDVANIDDTQYDVIRREFRRAANMLSRGQTFQQVLRSYLEDQGSTGKTHLRRETNKRQPW